MAAENGVDLTAVEGSGIHGRVTKRDLEVYLEKRSAETPVPVTSVPRRAEVLPPVQKQMGEFVVPAYSEGDNVEIEPMSNIRRLTAAHMAYSKRTSAHVTTVFDMDLSRVARLRNRAKDGFLATHGTKLTFMPFIFRAVANALIANPKLNASIDGTDVVFKKDVNLGMAVALDWGLIVPVVRHADRLNLLGLAKTANDLADRARGKKLSPDELLGGTFTITNPGVFGSLFGTPIINQPQVAILGVGAIEKRPVVDTDSEGNDTISIKTMAYFAITFDHRLVDGADADQFMIHMRQTLLEETWSELDAIA
jgi:2-oxoglutarate dehydrogenase E2 component (dihydrolipoamide succinyltransferase)